MLLFKLKTLSLWWVRVFSYANHCLSGNKLPRHFPLVLQLLPSRRQPGCMPQAFRPCLFIIYFFFPSFDSVSLLLLLLEHTPTCRCGLPGSQWLHRQGRQVLGMLNPSFSLNGGDLWGFPSGENGEGRRSREDVQWSLKFSTDWECTLWNAFISCDWCRLFGEGGGKWWLWCITVQGLPQLRNEEKKVMICISYVRLRNWMGITQVLTYVRNDLKIEVRCSTIERCDV